MKTIERLFSLILILLCAAGCSQKSGDGTNHVIMSLGKRIASLDPALAADTTSQSVVCAFYDTLLQYRYRAGEYTLEPSMLEKTPELSADGKTYRCVLRDDLYFQDDPAFAGKEKSARKVTSRDVVFSFLRLADPRLRSPGYWVVRDRVRGLHEFRKNAETAIGNSVYDLPCEGFTILSDQEFEIHLEQPNPRFHYSFALPYCAVVSRTVLEYYGENFPNHPAGSGPFRLEKWEQDYVLEMVRNPEFRREFYGEEKKPLPLADRITCYLVKQPVSSWLMFLQGELDFYALDGDHFESVVNKDLELAPALRARGIELRQSPQLETNYIGFNFADPLLGSNLDLRRAVTLVFDKKMRVRHSAGRFQEAFGPVPPGVPGYLDAKDAALPEPDVERAKEFLARAGFPGGIDPRTGKALVLSFDQTGSDTFYRQTAELFANDLKKIGIELRPEFNTRPRFLQKLATGNVQMFRLSWTGDYPDAENFLQLFYGPNAGSCNRVSYRDAKFDAMYEEILPLPESPERDRKYRAAAEYLTEQCPWIFETHTVAFLVTHCWLKNYIPHDFAFNRWKYLSADPELREQTKRGFRPVGMGELR